MRNLILAFSVLISLSSFAISQKKLSKYYGSILNNNRFNDSFTACLSGTIQNLRKKIFPSTRYLEKYHTSLPEDLYDSSFFHYTNSNFSGYSPSQIIYSMTNSGWGNYNSDQTMTNIAGGTGLYMSTFPSNSANFGHSLFVIKFSSYTKVFQAVDDIKRSTSYEYIPELKEDLNKIINDLDLNDCNNSPGRTLLMNVLAKISEAHLIKYTHKEMGWYVAINGQSSFDKRVTTQNFKKYSLKLDERTRQANEDLYHKNPQAYLNLSEKAKKVQVQSLNEESDIQFLFEYLHKLGSLKSFNFMFTSYGKWDTLRKYKKVSNKCSLELDFQKEFKGLTKENETIVSILSCLYKKECHQQEELKCL